MLALAFWWGSCSVAQAESYYKIVDSQGRVTYSARPPAEGGKEVEELKIRGARETPPAVPEQSDSERQAAKARALAEAQQRLIRAKANFEQAKIQDAGDWQVQQDGTRVLTSDYLSRVAAAQSEVESAERALQDVRQAPAPAPVAGSAAVPQTSRPQR